LEGRSGTLWESPYKSSVVQTETYLLACSRFIELNPAKRKRKKEKGKSEKGTPFFAGFANKQTALFLDAGN